MDANNGTAIHTNVLKPSLPDDVFLCEAVEERFLTLCKFYLSVRKVPLVPPPDLNADMLRWRTMRKRHKTKDYRHTLDELRSTQRVAQWTLDVNNRLRNQGQKTIEWEH